MQVIILVIPGVLICIFFLGFLVKYALNYEEMSFSAACILGSILASTDPVAVVALLKELGAPLHIETLIEMESLFNDGTSMVFFIIFSEIATGSEASFGSAIAMFFLIGYRRFIAGCCAGSMRTDLHSHIHKRKNFIYFFASDFELHDIFYC